MCAPSMSCTSLYVLCLYNDINGEKAILNVPDE